MCNSTIVFGLNPIPVVEHFRGSQPQCEHTCSSSPKYHSLEPIYGFSKTFLFDWPHKSDRPVFKCPLLCNATKQSFLNPLG